MRNGYDLEVIKNMLDEYGISSTSKGYTLLVHVIIYMAEHPASQLKEAYRTVGGESGEYVVKNCVVHAVGAANKKTC